MAIEFLRENNIRKEDDSFYEFGEVILIELNFFFFCNILLN